mmetsp:Transcript_21082/g.59974  ORF Transcript_21082/g.59974 Transcript_21082/m.59974 type:complete len:250 (+) Transcript_21082:291-1040(+)
MSVHGSARAIEGRDAGERLGLDFLAQAQVRELEVAAPVQEQVVRLEVSVDVPEGVDGFDSQNSLGGVEAGGVLREDVLLHEQGHEVSAGEELHDEVEVVLVLERVVEFNEPLGRASGAGMSEDVALGPHVRHLVFEHHGLLDHGFHSVNLTRVFLLDEADLAESAFPDDAQGHKVVRGHALAHGARLLHLLLHELLAEAGLDVVRERERVHLPLEEFHAQLALRPLALDLLVALLEELLGGRGTLLRRC